jgi:hypothetical protein
MYTPGLLPLKIPGDPTPHFQLASSLPTLEPARQPYFKLHGSSDWMDSQKGAVLIMGGQKEDDINKQPLLSEFIKRFGTSILSADARLMIIGYSFRDQHINDLIENGVRAGAKLFVVDPIGVDVLKNAPNRGGDARGFRGRIFASLAGASRRSLISTFSSDHAERSKLYRFIGG